MSYPVHLIRTMPLSLVVLGIELFAIATMKMWLPFLGGLL